MGPPADRTQERAGIRLAKSASNIYEILDILQVVVGEKVVCLPRFGDRAFSIGRGTQRSAPWQFRGLRLPFTSPRLVREDDAKVAVRDALDISRVLGVLAVLRPLLGRLIDGQTAPATIGLAVV